jgi:hypothetical protein
MFERGLRKKKAFRQILEVYTKPAVTKDPVEKKKID